MKNLKLVSLMALTALFLFLGGCQKDEGLINSNSRNPFISYDWSPNEAKFFNTNFEIKNEKRTKGNSSTSNFIYHPSIILLYNQIAQENQRGRFIDEFVVKYGVPLWKKALIYENKSKTESAIMIQITDGKKATGVITAIKKSNQTTISISFTTRNMLLNKYINFSQYNKVFDRIISLDDELKYEDQTLHDAYCACMYRTEIVNTVTETCEWMFIELCDGEPTYAGGYSSFPLYLDHDSDGILNVDDQDWLEWSVRHGFATQDEFRNKFIEWYDNHYDIEWDYSGDAYSSWYSNMMQAWYDWWDKYGDDDHDGILNGEDRDRNGNGQIDDEETELPCPFGGINDNSTQSRTINCDYVYAYICNGDYRYWYLGDYFGVGDIDQKRDLLISDLIAANPFLITYYTREQIKAVTSECDMFSPEFNKCSLLALMAKKQNSMNQYDDYNDFVQSWEHFNQGTYLDYFYKTYGVEKYYAATALYAKMRVNGINVSWSDIEARFKNWYIDNIDSGQEYSISGGFDWSKHSPVTSQSLPSYSGFYNAYPKQNGELIEGAANIFNLLNGPIRDLFDDYPNLRNVCALKVSIALNGAGIDIPFIFQDDNSNGIKDPGESSFTIPDDNGNYYFLNAKLLIQYMLEVFPAPTVTVNGNDLQNGATPESSFGVNSGIYGMLPLDETYFGASGHCDIWLPKVGASPAYNECGAGCHWGFVDVAYLWILN